MNNMNYYEKIREIRNKMFPERAKLEFGCEVEYYADDLTSFVCGIISNDENEIKIITHTTSGSFSDIISSNLIGKILGQPVTITDVLRMLNKKIGVFDDYGYMYAIDHNGGLFMVQSASYSNISSKVPMGYWKDDINISIILSKGDDIRHQPEETLKKIYELIS